MTDFHARDFLEMKNGILSAFPKPKLGELATLVRQTVEWTAQV
jgi:hypothetical protein